MGAKDMTSYETDSLKVVRRAANDKYDNAVWECLCFCGNTFYANGSAIRSGHTRSCGCLQRESARRLRKTHGGSGTRLFKIWTAMRYRCENSNLKSYKDYGAKGITVCPEWQRFDAFREWALANGYSDDLTIDRKKNDEGYSPENCRWVTRAEQNRNTTRTHRIYDGEQILTAAEAARVVGMDRTTVAGWCREGKAHTLTEVKELAKNKNKTED